MKSIRLKILAMLAIVAGGAILSAIISLYGLYKADDLNTRSEIQGNVALLTQRINGVVTAVVMDSRGVYMAKTSKEAEPFAKGIEDRFPTLRKFSADLQKVAPPEERAVVDQIAKAVEEFITFRAETARLGREVSPAAANEQGNNEANRTNRKALNDLLINFSQRVEKASIAVSDEATAFTRQVQWLMPVVLLMTLLVSVGVALIFAQRSITRPILDLSRVMEKLTAGDTRIDVPHAQREDEIGTMARAVSVLRQSTEQVALLQEQERAAAATRLARAQSMEAVVSDVGEVVAAAAAGDFSARLQIEDADEQMQRLVAGINEINAVVDGATTEFAGALSAIAGGDLTNRVETAYRGRFAELKGAINETVDRLSDTVATIQTTSADVGLAAREINMGADDLSKRTEEQASSLEETAATTEELAASVKASAQASKDAARIADEAMQAAENGGAIAGQAVDAMARIESASQKISDIIRVIDDIAFQTNLLALNAAVEAARAGDAGKGFAVVASEVRTLAQRSSEAAKDISGLISSSNVEVGEGVKLVRQAGDQLNRILAASQKVAATIADISAASGEQANGIDEMSQAVAHLDEMTQQNAALSEQSAASANALSGRIEQLNGLVATFKTGREPASQTAYAQPATPARAKAPMRAARPAPAASGEPERLRQLAEAAFVQSRAPAPRKVANGGRANDSGWEEF
ncbi:methyl-accepting chemotaxis protein [Bosea sp. AK1]|uniref:methyl-accepting chemotaxis protein n=1 Tax=Bosea sp. AK1 TaxID=2587160 RepID=UPI001172C636|nr:methyl-accepting chemotaxis protein [Bosea sp. AK1]TQI74683.1 methyl-accepting chemotaxis protein [Bosea sp. AK1]